MKKSGLSEQQIAFVLRRAEEGTAVAEVCRKAGISEASFYNWRKRGDSFVPCSLVQSPDSSRAMLFDAPVTFTL
jgi:putative transposase